MTDKQAELDKKLVELNNMFDEFEPLVPFLVRVDTRENHALHRYCFDLCYYKFGVPAHLYNRPVAGSVIKVGDINEARWCPAKGGFRFKHERDADEFARYAVDYKFKQAGEAYDSMSSQT